MADEGTIPTGAGPLHGYRVVELCTMITGPLAAMQLGDLGADVIKVEAPGLGDVMRYTGTAAGGMSALWATCNRSKRSVVLDLKTPEGLDGMLRLLDTADVFLTNTRPGVVERLGIGEDVVRARNTDIVWTAITGFGDEGPFKDRPAYDNVVQTWAGAPVVQADLRTGEPRPIRTFLADKITAYTAVQAVCAALLARHRGSGGQRIEVDMLDATLAFLWCDGFGEHTWLGDAQHPVSHLPNLNRAFEVFATADGHISLAVILQEQFEGLCRAAERPDWLTDTRFSDAFSRLGNVDALIAEIAAGLTARSTAEWVERLVAAGVPCAPVGTLDDVLANPQVVANGSVVLGVHPHAGPMRQPKPPIWLSATPSAIARPAPLLGEHTDEVLGALP